MHRISAATSLALRKSCGEGVAEPPGWVWNRPIKVLPAGHWIGMVTLVGVPRAIGPRTMRPSVVRHMLYPYSLAGSPCATLAPPARVGPQFWNLATRWSIPWRRTTASVPDVLGLELELQLEAEVHIVGVQIEGVCRLLPLPALPLLPGVLPPGTPARTFHTYCS